MMTDSDLLKRIDQRQEIVIEALSGLTDVMRDQKEALDWLVTWANEPPSDALPKLLTELTARIGALQDAIVAQKDRIEEIASAVAR
jgi:hypothetical protein